jgi:hypothetical protein
MSFNKFGHQQLADSQLSHRMALMACRWMVLVKLASNTTEGLWVEIAGHSGNTLTQPTAKDTNIVDLVY